jgi:FkbM family methyltransferase
MSQALTLRRIVGRPYRWCRRQTGAIQVFKNWRKYFETFDRRDGGETVLQTRSGLRILVRHNHWDVRIVREQFVDRFYLRHFQAPAGRTPMVMDVGSYIGDFALFCAHELGARVLAYEPTAENRAMLERNIALNPQLAGRIAVVPKGIAATSQVLANVQTHGREIHVSSYMYSDDPEAERRMLPCDTLDEAIAEHGLERVDLLKVDCEGGEYDIFPATDRETYDRIGSIVFEWHRLDDWEPRLRRVADSLRAVGFTVTFRGQLGYAFREA